MNRARDADHVLSAARVADRLHSAAIQLLRRLRVEDKRTGLSGPRASALSVVVFAGPITLGDLAAAEQVKPPTMTRLVTGMEAQGLVQRVGDTADARVVRVRATAKGIRILQEGRARRIARLQTILHDLPATELATLGEATILLEQLVGEL